MEVVAAGSDARAEVICRAVVADDVAALLAAAGAFASQTSWPLDKLCAGRLLHLACKHDAVACARLLLEGGAGIAAAHVDAPDPYARTPLHIAAEEHAPRCIDLLLSKEASTKAVDSRNLLPLDLALLRFALL